MRSFICYCSLSMLLLNCKAQPSAIQIKDSIPSTTVYGEFGKKDNGLIYSVKDINTLRFIVDSLNLKFKTCDLNRNYLSYPQGKMYHLRFESKTDDLKELNKYLGTQPDLYTTINKFSKYLIEVDSNRLIIKTPYQGDEGNGFLTGNALNGFNSSYEIKDKAIGKNKKWAFSYNEKDNYNKAYSIECSYIPNELTMQTIPSDYAKLVQYIDCMIDTTATIFLGKGKGDYFERASSKSSAAYRAINDYLNKKLNYTKNKNEYGFNYLDSAKMSYAINNLSKDKAFVDKVNALAELYISNETGDDNVEDLIAALISKDKALEIKRKRRVYGQCSMDNSPRVHAKNIAVLAAETHSWDIFLRSHLNIMNDRFERMSDGSYAYGMRQTYIKELEVLDINVIDMMLGLSLRSYNVADNHYNGTVWRIGRALSESKDRLLFEERAKKIMKDDRLDQFNRSLIFLLYHTYLNHLIDKNETKTKIDSLKKESSAYPSFIQAAIGKLDLQSYD